MDKIEFAKLLLEERPELITDDPLTHAENIILYGNSILVQRVKSSTGFFGKSLREVMVDDER